MTTTQNTAILTDLLAKYFTNKEGVLVKGSIETAEYFISMFLIWDDVVEQLDDNSQDVWWVHYLIIGALTGGAVRDSAFPQYKRTVLRKVEEKLGQEKADRFDQMVDQIVYGTFRQDNQFFADNEVLILSTVVDDAFNNATKLASRGISDQIVQACDVCKWKFLYKIALITSGAEVAFNLNTRLVNMRVTEVTGVS